MPQPELDRLVAIGRLETEARNDDEFQALVHEAEVTLADSQNDDLALESRFRLAYGGVHAIAVAALRWHGYRPRDRQVAFLTLAHTLAAPTAVWRMLAKSHELRNRREYEGAGEVDPRTIEEIIAAGRLLLEPLRRLKA
jgi:hypothetical protein